MWICEIALLLWALIFRVPPVRAQMPVSPWVVSQTNVIRFMPEVPSGDIRDGSCWTESIAVTRSGAWRCAVGNSISDPCFAVPPNREQLVCGANPALKNSGFLLKLTKPLPKRSGHERKAEPWVFRLADNSVCEAMTGTMAIVNEEPARWSCAIHVRDQVRPTGVVTALTPGKIWIADKFPESAIGTQGAKPHKIPVRAIWE
jgi:hypothetical protein